MAESSPGTRPLVLIVDDSTVARRELVVAMGEAFEIQEAENGAAALALAKATAFDLILTDINMPIMDGIQMTRLLRAIPHCQGAPVFAVTSESSREVIENGKAAGITAWILKPVNAAVLRRGIVALLQRTANGQS